MLPTGTEPLDEQKWKWYHTSYIGKSLFCPKYWSIPLRQGLFNDRRLNEELSSKKHNWTITRMAEIWPQFFFFVSRFSKLFSFGCTSTALCAKDKLAACPEGLNINHVLHQQAECDLSKYSAATWPPHRLRVILRESEKRSNYVFLL